MKEEKLAPKKSAKRKTNALGLPLVKPNKNITKFLKVEFSEKEIQSFGGLLANTTKEIHELENDKKGKMSEFTASINTKKALAESLSNKVCNGYEYTDVECTVYLNMPNTGKKTIERKDTKEEVEVLDMTVEELQIEMDFKTID